MDPADRHARHRRRRDDGRDAVGAECRGRVRFRRGVPHGPDAEVVDDRRVHRRGLLRRRDGQAQQEVRRDPPHLVRRQVALPQVHAVDAGDQRDVHGVVHQQRDSRAPQHVPDGQDEREALAVGALLGAHLDGVDATRDGGADDGRDAAVTALGGVGDEVERGPERRSHARRPAPSRTSCGPTASSSSSHAIAKDPAGRPAPQRVPRRWRRAGARRRSRRAGRVRPTRRRRRAPRASTPPPSCG